MGVICSANQSPGKRGTDFETDFLREL